MPYLVSKLITEAFYLSKIVSRSLESVTGDQSNFGLDLLNFILSSKDIDKTCVPYYKEFVFPAIINQEKYFIPRLLDIESFTFNIGNVRYETIEVGRKNYFGTSRVDQIASLPFKWHMERILDGMDLYLYFVPADIYTLKLWGKFGFDQVTKFEDLALTFDYYYIDYLRHELAASICNEYGITLPQQTATNLEAMRLKLGDESPMDLTAVRRSTLGGFGGLNYADINLGRGWRPRYNG